MQQNEIDDDGQPVWTFAPGEELVNGIAAWERLGVGARCETWLGWSRLWWCPVTVKLARPHQCSHPRARQSLGREVSALRDNFHPVLPRLIRSGLDEDIPNIVLEFIDGNSLDVVVEDSPLDAPSTAMLGTHLLSALMTLHGRDLAHLDIKPENVMVRDGRPTLIDLGSARRIGRLQPAGHPVGTVGYAAPEMERCEPISTAMDVYGVGATLREAFTGLSVYDDDPERRRAAAAPLDPAAHPALVGIISAMLSPEPADRPTVAGALDCFADLFDADLRPWPDWLTARESPAAREIPVREIVAIRAQS